MLCSTLRGLDTTVSYTEDYLIIQCSGWFSVFYKCWNYFINSIFINVRYRIMYCSNQYLRVNSVMLSSFFYCPRLGNMNRKTLLHVKERREYTWPICMSVCKPAISNHSSFIVIVLIHWTLFKSWKITFSILSKTFFKTIWITPYLPCDY